VTAAREIAERETCRVLSTEQWATLLALPPPWVVERVNVDESGHRVSLRIGRGREGLTCPRCGASAPQYDHRLRAWRELDIMAARAIVEAAVPRVSCPTHGVQAVPVPWAAPGHRVTLRFECRIRQVVAETSAAACARLMQLSRGTVLSILRDRDEVCLAGGHLLRVRETQVVGTARPDNRGRRSVPKK
jgi:transposase